LYLTLARRTAALLAATVLTQSPVYAGAEGIRLPPFDGTAYTVLASVIAVSIAALVYGFALRAQVLRLSPGTVEMQKVGDAIRSGAYAYLRRQVRAMSPLVAGLAVLLFFLFRSQPGYTVTTSLGVSFAFLLGVILSYAAGYIGMGMAVAGNQRTANQALTSYKGALEAAFRSGAVAGMMTVGLGLLGAAVVFLAFQADAMKVLIGFGFGGSLAALFMRVGGGIFTKAADVGADLVGKVEHDIPEDDPRNAATIADNVGDNVGDCAGMAADVFESYLVTLVAAIILGYAAGDANARMSLILLPLAIHAIGIVASIIGIATLRGSEDLSQDPLKPISRGFAITAAAATVGFVTLCATFSGIAGGVSAAGGQIFPWWKFAVSTAIGVILALTIGRLTEHFTGSQAQPVREVAKASQTGPATLILTGFSLGLESSTWSVVVIGAALAGIVAVFDGNAMMTAYGIALAGLGLLTTTGYVLAMDTFGPIADNANGIFEMSGALKTDHAANGNGAHPAKPSIGGQVVSQLDSAGNTTKALTKGFAIATAVIAAVALFRTFMTDAHLSEASMSLSQPKVFIGLLIGGAAPFLFCSFAINAVSRAAFQLVKEVRRQFREIPGIMEGTGTPDYARCVEISTTAAQRELLGPGVLAICLPVIVGFALGAPALGGYLAGAILAGQLMAVLLSNSGGAWDNAKKKIEDGLYGGKGSDSHKAAVIGDTVGDPFKDTAGPALNPLIKVMNLVGVLIAGIVVSPMQDWIRIAVVLVTGSLLAGAIVFSKRGGMDMDDETNQPAGVGIRPRIADTHEPHAMH